MPSANIYSGIKHVVQIRSDEGTMCEICKQTFSREHLTESVNHYIEKHEYKLLHIGQETGRDFEGNIWHTTVAILGE